MMSGMWGVIANRVASLKLDSRRVEIPLRQICMTFAASKKGFLCAICHYVSGSTSFVVARSIRRPPSGDSSAFFASDA
jgi:hypothetical protein